MYSQLADCLPRKIDVTGKILAPLPQKTIQKMSRKQTILSKNNKMFLNYPVQR